MDGVFQLPLTPKPDDEQAEVVNKPAEKLWRICPNPYNWQTALICVEHTRAAVVREQLEKPEQQGG